MEGTAWAQLYTCETCDNVREQSAAAGTALAHSVKTLNGVRLQAEVVGHQTSR